jgi:hypothetical protein
MRHELGHAFDNVLRVNNVRASHWRVWREAYDADVAEMMANPADVASKQWRYKYFLQGGNAGYQEAFAEVFARIHGGGGNGSRFLLEDWPRTSRVMRDLIENL